nr:hypothetical protein [Flavobacterium sp. ASV13]
MSTNHNRIKVADLETNQPNKILKTNQNGELEFSDAINPQTESYNALDCTSEGKTLDARQGKVLKEMIDNKESVSLVNDLTTGGTTKALTAEMGKTLNNIKLTATLATDAETKINYDISEDNKIVSRSKLFNWWDWIKSQVQIISGVWNFVYGLKSHMSTSNIDYKSFITPYKISIQRSSNSNSGLNDSEISVDADTLSFTVDGRTMFIRPDTMTQFNEIILPNQSGTVAMLDSPTFTGVPTAPTAISGTNTTQIATTEFVKIAVNNVPIPVVQDVSTTQSGIVNNIILQELGGVDKTINGLRIGKGAGSNTNGSTAMGSNALNLNTTGSSNSAFGAGVLSRNVSGYYNTAVGNIALTNNTSGFNNSTVGGLALYANTTGGNNTSIGYASLSANTLGSSNIAIGFSALPYSITGDKNIGIGISAGSGITSGSGNTIIGGVTSGISASDSNLVVLANGVGTVAIRKESDNRLLAPTLTQALILSGGNTSLINKTYADNMGAVTNSTSVALTSANLTSAYPNALLGFRVHCNSITTGGLIYEKTSNGWLQYAVTVVV